MISSNFLDKGRNTLVARLISVINAFVFTFFVAKRFLSTAQLLCALSTQHQWQALSLVIWGGGAVYYIRMKSVGDWLSAFFI